MTFKNRKYLHNHNSHPVCIVKDLIYEYFTTINDKKPTIYDNLSPIVSIISNFDKSFIGEKHITRKRTFYVDETHVMRSHISAHQSELLENGDTCFLVTGDVYRNEKRNFLHNTVFHQTEGVYIDVDETMTEEELIKNLLDVVKKLCEHFISDEKIKIKDNRCPFTQPTYKIEIYHNDKWIEIISCGVFCSRIIEECSKKNVLLKNDVGDVKKGWAFCVGLERLAMILFDIPDIRLIDASCRFLSQFSPKTITKYKPYLSSNIFFRDVSFYIPGRQLSEDASWLCENDMFKIIHNVSEKKYMNDELILEIVLLDQYFNDKLQKYSRTYRIYYINTTMKKGNKCIFGVDIHYDIVELIKKSLGLEIR